MFRAQVEKWIVAVVDVPIWNLILVDEVYSEKRCIIETNSMG